MMGSINVAVIGTGSMGRSHARVYSQMKEANLAAICDTDGQRAKEISKEYGARGYSDCEAMLKSEKIDAVSVCVPTKLHSDIALKAIRRKIHVLVEKPIAATIDEAKEMIAEAGKNEAKLMVGHIERFNPVVLELKRRIKANQLGRIYQVHAARISPFPRRIIDVGVIVDLAIHEIDIMKHLIDSKIKRVYAETARRIHSSHEDLLIGTIRFENNILGVINANWLTPKKIREISVTGEKGMFAANYLAQELYFHENDFTRQNSGYDSSFMNVVEGKMTRIKVEKSEPLMNELKAFVQSIASNKNPPVTGADGLEALDIAQKFIESSKTNKVIAV